MLNPIPALKLIARNMWLDRWHTPNHRFLVVLNRHDVYVCTYVFCSSSGYWAAFELNCGKDEGKGKKYLRIEISIESINFDDFLKNLSAKFLLFVKKGFSLFS